MENMDLITGLRATCDKVALNRKLMLAVTDYCYQEYGVPQAETMDVINDRVPLDQKPDDFLFFLAAALSKHVTEFTLSTYYSLEETQKYNGKKYLTEENYRIAIPCIAVVPNKQWIGAVDARFFLELDRNNKIKYNFEKQRVRQKIVKGNEVIFKTKINMRSVNQIAKLMQNGDYISDYITLDIPYENQKNIFMYSENNRELVFDNLDSFDITDGYHRLEAMRKCYEADKTFNYPMGIQITQFSLQKTQQFIYQSDQKNKMSASESNSFDALRPSNEVCNFLNEDGGCIYNKLIKRNGDRAIDYTALSDIIDYYWFGPGLGDKKKRDFERQDILLATKEVKELLNSYAEENPTSIGRYIGFPELVLYFYLIKNKQKKPDEAAKKVIKYVENGKINNIKLRGMRKTLFDQIEKLGF